MNPENNGSDHVVKSESSELRPPPGSVPSAKKGGSNSTSSVLTKASVPKLSLGGPPNNSTVPTGTAPSRTPSGIGSASLGTLSSRSSQTSDSGGGNTASTAVRVFVTSNLTPNRFCALIIKHGWKIDDFLSVANTKLSLTSSSPRTGAALQGGASVVWLQNGVEVSSLDELREDDQLLLRFHRASPRLNSVPSQLTPPATPKSGIWDTGDRAKCVPVDGVFRIITPEFVNLSPLALSEEQIADLVQSECKYNDFYCMDVPTMSGIQQSSVRALLRRALLPNDATFQDTLLYSYDYFLTHHSFLSILIVHFRAPLAAMDTLSPRGASVSSARPTPVSRPGSISFSSSVLPTYGMSIQLTDPIRRGAAQTRIINIIKRWIETRYLAIEEDLISLELLDDFITYLVASPDRLQTNGDTLANTLKSTRRQHLSRQRNLELSKQHILPKERTGFTKGTEASPFELACQLTLADQEIFHKLRMAELQSLRFDQPTASIYSPTVVEWQAHNRYISSWVMASILGTAGEPNQSSKKRALTIGHFIAAMEELKVMRSYNAMMQICLALANPIIARLDNSWDFVSAKYQTSHNAVMDFMATSFKGYLSHIESSEPPCVPYLEFHLNELRMLEESSATVLPNGEVNFSKLEALAKVINSVTRCHKTQYDLSPHHVFYTFIITSDVPSNATLAELSLHLETDSDGVGSVAAAAVSTTSKPSSSSTSITTTSGSGKITVRSGGARSSTPEPGSGKFLVDKEHRRRDSISKKIDKDKEKDKDKAKDKLQKKLEKQAKKIRPLLTPTLTLEQGVANPDIFEQFTLFSADTPHVNTLMFFKAIVDFRKLFTSDSEPAGRRARAEAQRILAQHVGPNANQQIEFSDSLDPNTIKSISAKANSDGLWTNNLLDPLTKDVQSALNAAFSAFKSQKTL